MEVIQKSGHHFFNKKKQKKNILFGGPDRRSTQQYFRKTFCREKLIIGEILSSYFFAHTNNSISVCLDFYIDGFLMLVFFLLSFRVPLIWISAQRRLCFWTNKQKNQPIFEFFWKRFFKTFDRAGGLQLKDK